VILCCCARNSGFDEKMEKFEPLAFDTVKYGRFLHFHEYHEIKNFMQFQRQFYGQRKVNSIHGIHYSNCVWSSDECIEGPNTCICVVYDRRRKIVEDYLSRCVQAYEKREKNIQRFLKTKF
jgi:hypothetical protein